MSLPHLTKAVVILKLRSFAAAAGKGASGEGFVQARGE
jgi:hypothetical protein